MKPNQQKEIIKMLTAQTIAKEKEHIRKTLASAMMAATLITLHDKYDWGKKRLMQIMAEIFTQFECVEGKFVEVEDFYKWLETIGVTVNE
jgi:hypothetical protein